MQPRDVIVVTVQFPVANAGENVNVEPLDGGRLSNAASAVGDDGVVTFRFQASPNAGQNRVVVRHGLKSLRLQFWVLNPAPQNNPPVITPANQGD